MIEASARTDIGRVRQKNEDAFLIDESIGLYAVADGMGGHQAGEVASRLALETVRNCLLAAAGDAEAALQEAIRTANRAVFGESLERGHVQGMGTTAVVFWAPAGTFATLAHVGDSRAYRVREGRLEQLTRDHSWVQAQIDAGLVRPEDASTHPMRHVITRSIGFEPEIEADVLGLELRPGDLYLLASDGLTGKIADPELAERLGRSADETLEALLDDLIAQANRRGGEDNITALLLRVRG